MSATPGPWKAVKQNVPSFFVVYAGKVQVADLYGLTGERDEDGDDGYISEEESAANAHLIAAAPALVEVLKDLVAYMDAGDYRSNRLTEIMIRARAALREAGEGDR